MGEKSLLCIYILQILHRYSSEKCKLRQTDIVQYLEHDFGLRVNRNTVSRYIQELKRHGFINGERGIYLIRLFTNYEIKMLCDTLMYSQAIPQKNVREIAEKLMELSEPGFRKHLVKTYGLDKVWHVENEKIGEIIEQIGEAIDGCRKIEITSCKYSMDGQLIPSGVRIVDPYFIVIEKSRYYLLCYSGRNDVEPRRIDRICSVRILEKPRMEINKIPKYSNHNFRLSQYMREHIYMYTGEEERITIRINSDNIGDFIDWYGKDYRVIEYPGSESSYAVIQIRANINAVYFWALQYGQIAEVLCPEGLRDKIRKGLEQMLDKYKKDLP